jgi:hypothetical protein
MERALMTPFEFPNYPVDDCGWRPKMTRKNTKDVKGKTRPTNAVEFRDTGVMRAYVQPVEVKVECGRKSTSADEYASTITSRECLDKNEITITREKPRDPEIDER